ncbi:hypothetical protein GTQ99_23200 [Kineococcus sp. T13]|uniref:hypothetical protein n=1 Tax=Kineococcus vitellinus TaxID=2696565 RepID=UPI001412DBD1|nr:hypothetical protein [Kineococcus vitellinus]NAZ78290.1 hypothetical protein [Kineococcus vitellinus]
MPEEPEGSDERGDWRARRSQAAAAHAAAAERARAQETARAREALASFAAELRRRGVPAGPLRARVGRARARTGLTGWYLRRDGSLGLGADGGFYVLDVAPRPLARLLGVRVEPSDPPLQVGRGARDGESVELLVLLQRRLAELTGPEGPRG